MIFLDRGTSVCTCGEENNIPRPGRLFSSCVRVTTGHGLSTPYRISVMTEISSQLLHCMSHILANEQKSHGAEKNNSRGLFITDSEK
jgi:hypothetical protein